MIPREFEIFFNENFHSAMYVAQKVVVSRQIAEDIVQDVFIRMLDLDLGRIKYPSRYLLVAVRHASIDYVRSQGDTLYEKMYEFESDEGKTFLEMEEEELEYALNLQKLFNAINGLPERSRDVVKLVCLEKYSYREAARELGMTVSTVKTHMYRSVRLIRKYMALFLL